MLLETMHVRQRAGGSTAGGRTARVTLADLQGAPEAQGSELLDVVLGGAHTLVVDLADVPALSSSAVSSLLNAHRLCRTRGGSVHLQNCGRAVLDTLQRTSLSQVFAVHGSPPDAAGAGSLR